MKPINLILRNGLLLWFSLILATSFADLIAQCEIQTQVPDTEYELAVGQCTYEYTLPLVVASPGENSGGGICVVYLAEVNGIDLNGPNPYGATGWIVIDGVNSIGLPPGQLELTYVTTDHGPNDPIEDSMTFTVDVMINPFGIACNDGVQVSLGTGCQAIITPDMILEGNYCYDAYTLVVLGEDGVTLAHDISLGGVAISSPGDYTVTVTGPFGNSCWSSILAEDKVLPAVSCCDEIVVPCYQSDLSPLASILGDVPVGDPLNVGTIAQATPATDDDPSQPSTSEIDFTFAAANEGNTIMDLKLDLELETNDPGSIMVKLMSPLREVTDANGDPVPEVDQDGNPTGATVMTRDTVKILDMTGAAGCTQPNIDITVDDGAFEDHSDLVLEECGQCSTEAYCGDYKSFGLGLSSFIGTQIDGVWTLAICNFSESSQVAGGSAQLTYTEQTSQICRPQIEKFDPTGNLLTPIWVQIGTREFEVSFPGNACSDIIASYDDADLPFECTDEYLSGFTREWTFTATSGLSASSSCEQTIYFNKFGIGDVIYPPNFDGIDMPTVDCADYFNPSNTSDLLDPVTGVVGYPSLEFGALCDNFNVATTDVVLQTCGTSFKLIRQYLVTDWCTGEIDGHNQVIKVEDNFIAATAPIDLQVVGTDNQHDCTADIFVDPLGQGPNGYGFQFQAVIENCNDFDVTVGFLEAELGTDQPVQGSSYQSATSLGNGEWLIPEIQAGPVWVRYTVEDECGNTAESFFEILVEDQSAPNAVCLEHTVAAIGETGCAKVRAESFDNGSFDNCGTVDFRARIMNSNASFTDKVEFCCSSGYTCESVEMVEFVVFDADLGDLVINSNFSNVPDGVQYSVCMVEVEFQDKIAPVFLNGPSNVTVACDVVIESAADLANFIDMSSLEVSDNCSNVSPTMNGVSFPISGNECGGGSRTISWSVEDGCGNSDSHSATITFGDASPVSNVQFPFNGSNIEFFGCPEFGPDNPLTPEQIQAQVGFGLVFPNANDPACNSMASSYEDQYFPNVNDDGLCMKIVRTWTVIDWCTFDPNSNSTAGVFTSSQVITFADSNAPVIFAPSPVNCATDVLYNSAENECQPFVKIVLDATDDCDELDWSVSVVECGGLFGTQTFNSPDISGFYTHGSIEVTATVTDVCGNETTGVYTITIPDCKAPTPYCLGEIVTVTLPSNLTTEIWANDFELGSFDDFAAINNCTACPDAGTAPLEYYFLDDNGNYVPVLELSCDDIPNGQEATISLDVWVVDPNGAPGFDADFCTVELILQDNESEICPDITGGEGEGSSRGNIHMYDNRTINESVVVISSNQPEFPKSYTTGTDGDYTFTELPVGNSYQIETGKNTAVLNGVSTLDILLIQRHLLSLTSFTNPYQYIAADANNSEYVSAADMVAIRNVILEKTSEFTNGQESWRFVDASAEFNDPTSPFPYDEEIAFTLNGDLSGQDFVAVKIGDVSNDASPAFDGSSLSETRGVPLRLSIPTTQYTAGEEVRLEVTSDNFEDILGMQFTLGYDSSLTFDRFEAGIVNMSEEFAGFNSADEGKITVSWNTTAAITADLDDVLFTLVYTALTDGSTDQITIDNSITSDEAYDNQLNVIGIDLINGNGGELATEGYSLYQNTPNPFSEVSTIAFSLPTSQEATLTIYDMSGRLLETFSGVYAKGLNEVTVDSGTLQNESGVFYYQLSTNGYTATKKMILTN